ncbi:hypothetical protein ACHAWX_004337, partial [Stephanocyclus meneghinianus]
MTMSKVVTSSYRILHGKLDSIRGILKISSPSVAAIPKRFLFNQTKPPSSSQSPCPHDTLTSFANLDHRRASRTGFPEAVFGQGKTPAQIHAILDSMANDVNQLTETNNHVSPASTAIIATRIDPELYHKVLSIGPLKYGSMEYHETARIIAVRANSLSMKQEAVGTTTTTTSQSTSAQHQSVVVACAGTTDLPVAEEAAVTLSLSGVPVTRVYDCGVAGLHRIISALPKLRDPSVGCVIVCAGMDGALPSVVGG